MANVNIRDELKKGKPIYGVECAMKKMKTGKLKRIFISSNCPEKARLADYAKATNVEIVELEENNAQLGVLCKRPHAISVLAFE
jgi:ribosomal protein L30E